MLLSDCPTVKFDKCLFLKIFTNKKPNVTYGPGGVCELHEVW